MSATMKQRSQRDPVTEQRQGQELILGFVLFFCHSLSSFPCTMQIEIDKALFLGTAKDSQPRVMAECWGKTLAEGSALLAG